MNATDTAAPPTTAATQTAATPISNADVLAAFRLPLQPLWWQLLRLERGAATTMAAKEVGQAAKASAMILGGAAVCVAAGCGSVCRIDYFSWPDNLGCHIE
ncbi:hypothetical protein ACA910_007848 [Epithemia clementina (nom. ined.)]